MTTLVITTIVDEYARITEATVPMLIVIFTTLGIMVDSSCASDVRWSFDRSFECPREGLLPELILSKRVVIRIPVLASIHVGIDLTVIDCLCDLHILLCVIEPILFRVNL